MSVVGDGAAGRVLRATTKGGHRGQNGKRKAAGGSRGGPRPSKAIARGASVLLHEDAKSAMEEFLRKSNAPVQLF